MVAKTKRTFCKYCGLIYDSKEKADECKKRHDLIYVALDRKDLNALLHFCYTGDEKLLGPNVVRVLEKYQRRVALGKEETV